MSSLIIGCPGRLSGGSHFDVGAGGAEGVTSRWRGINRGNRGVGAKKPLISGWRRWLADWLKVRGPLNISGLKAAGPGPETKPGVGSHRRREDIKPE